jgi:hypothetical protein
VQVSIEVARRRMDPGLGVARPVQERDEHQHRRGPVEQLDETSAFGFAAIDSTLIALGPSGVNGSDDPIEDCHDSHRPAPGEDGFGTPIVETRHQAHDAWSALVRQCRARSSGWNSHCSRSWRDAPRPSCRDRRRVEAAVFERSERRRVLNMERWHPIQAVTLPTARQAALLHPLHWPP